jgi:hypothetical protein
MLTPHPPPSLLSPSPGGLPQGLGAWTHFAHQVGGLKTPEVDSFVKAAVFSTLTNVSEGLGGFRGAELDFRVLGSLGGGGVCFGGRGRE